MRLSDSPTVSIRMHDDEVEVSEDLVHGLLLSQMPRLAGLGLTKVEPWGTDNAIWRLGDDLTIRLPRIHWAAGQPAFEAEWLPRLATYLPVRIPEPIAIGEPGDGYPYRWSVHRWLPGTGAAIARWPSAAPRFLGDSWCGPVRPDADVSVTL
jgi:aminoglycoside phosphotransferase (APT) family kinase protein